MKTFIALLCLSLSCQAEELAGYYPPTGIHSPEMQLGLLRIQKSLDEAEVVKPRKENFTGIVPVYVNGRNTPDSHLLKEHGVNPARLQGLTQAEKNLLHGKVHPELQYKRVQVSSGCPGGVCPTRQIFRRRR